MIGRKSSSMVSAHDGRREIDVERVSTRDELLLVVVVPLIPLSQAYL